MIRFFFTYSIAKKLPKMSLAHWHQTDPFFHVLCQVRPIKYVYLFQFFWSFIFLTVPWMIHRSDLSKYDLLTIWSPIPFEWPSQRTPPDFIPPAIFSFYSISKFKNLEILLVILFINTQFVVSMYIKKHINIYWIKNHV